jgi:hypothetical protein
VIRFNGADLLRWHSAGKETRRLMHFWTDEVNDARSP